MAMSCFIFHDWEKIPDSSYVTRTSGGRMVDIDCDYVCLDCGKKKLTATRAKERAREDHARQTARRCKAEQLAKLPEPKAEPLSPVAGATRVHLVVNMLITIITWIFIVLLWRSDA